MPDQSRAKPAAKARKGAGATPADLLSRIEALSAQVAKMAEQVSAIDRRTLETRALVGPFGVPMPEDRMLVQTLHGLKYLIDPRDLIMAPQLIVYRQWEPDLSALFDKLLTPESVVVDVGANFGYFTCLAGARIGTAGSGRVFAVEANPEMVRLLHANLAINWSMCPVDVFAVAAGEKAGRVRLSQPVDRAANASLTPSDEADALSFEIQMKPLDALVPKTLAVDLLKIDVEGHEAGVLKGARKLLARSPNVTVVMEWSRPQMAEAGCSAAEMSALIADLGLAAWTAPADGLVANARPLSAEALANISYANILLRRA